MKVFFMHPIGLAGIAVILVLIGGIMATMVIPDLMRNRAQAAADAPLTIEEFGQATLAEVLTASPQEVREAVEEAQIETPAVTFESCDQDGAAGFKVRTPCVTPATTTLTLSGRDMAIFDVIGRFDNLRGVTMQGGTVATLAPLAQYPDLQSLILVSVQRGDASALNDLTALTRLTVYATSLVDLSAISQMSALTSLNLAGYQGADLNMLSGLTQLADLSLEGARVANYDALLI